MSYARIRAEPINLALAEHQGAAGDWSLQEQVKDLHAWAERFICQFKLKIGVPALCVERLRRTRYGHYCSGRNAFGLRDEIAINILHLELRPYWQTLGTLLHELIHSWQHACGKAGKSNYHNRQFRSRALDYGLVVDQCGRTQYMPPPTAFFDVLKQHGMEAPAVPALELAPAPPAVGSKLQLWMCSCGFKVRVARPDFQAVCLKCNTRFELQYGPKLFRGELLDDSFGR